MSLMRQYSASCGVLLSKHRSVWDMSPSEPSPRGAPYAGCFNHDTLWLTSPAPPWSTSPPPSPPSSCVPLIATNGPLTLCQGLLWFLSQSLVGCSSPRPGHNQHQNSLFAPPLSLPARQVSTFRFSLFCQFKWLNFSNYFRLASLLPEKKLWRAGNSSCLTFLSFLAL